jgi:hypothetical protein
LLKSFSGLIFPWNSQDKYFFKDLWKNIFFLKHTVMTKNAYFLSQSFSNPTGWQQGAESGNSFRAFNETTWSEIN